MAREKHSVSRTDGDGLVRTNNHISKDTMTMVKREVHKRNGMKKYASGISVTPPSYYNPLYTPTSLQLPRDRKQINVWSFAPGTKVLMADGTNCAIEDVKIGDLVRSANNVVRPVTHTYMNEVAKDMVTIEAGDNQLSVTHDHICYVVEDKDIDSVAQKGNDLRVIVKEKYASEIQKGDWMFRAIPTGISSFKDTRLAYLLGAYLAEGYIYDETQFVNNGTRKDIVRKSWLVELKYGLGEKPIVDYVVHLANELGFNTTVSSNINTFRVYIKNNEFVKLCRTHCGRGSKNKILSNDILFSDITFLQAFMNGYVDGDGNQNKTNKLIQFATSSDAFAAQLKSIILPRLGIISSHINYIVGKSLNDGVGYPTNFVRIPRRYAEKFTGCVKEIDASQGNLALANKRRIKLVNSNIFYQVQKTSTAPYIGPVYDITIDQDFNLVGNYFSIRNCRHFYNTEAIPAAVIDLYASLPITGYKIECQNPHVRKSMEDMIKRLKIRKICQGIALEYFMIGDVFVLSELDDEHKTWKRLVILNPDQIEVRRNVLADEPVIEMIPDQELQRIIFDQQPPELYQYFRTFLPDVIKAVKAGKNIPIDPSHITHFKHMPTPYGVYGTPLLKRIFKTLMYKEMIRRAQFVIAERYVTPLKIFKLGTIDEPPPQEEIDAMQAQLDAVLNDPSLVLVTTQRLTADWQGISGKTLQLTGEYDFLEREMIAGLGVSRAFLDGLGPTYANASIGGNAFLQKLENFRTDIKEWIEDKIFKPICELQQFYDTDPDTDEEFLIKVEWKWDALRLQDEATWQQALVGLRQMTMVSAKTLLEAFHINPETEAINLTEERDTIFDANRIMARQIALTQGITMQLQGEFQKKMMEMQMDMGGGGAMAGGGGMGSMPAQPGQSGVSVGDGGDMLSGFGGAPNGALPNNTFAPLDNAGQRPPVAAALNQLQNFLKEIRAIQEADDD